MASTFKIHNMSIVCKGYLHFGHLLRTKSKDLRLVQADSIYIRPNDLRWLDTDIALHVVVLHVPLKKTYKVKDCTSVGHKNVCCILI